MYNIVFFLIFLFEKNSQFLFSFCQPRLNYFLCSNEKQTSSSTSTRRLTGKAMKALCWEQSQTFFCRVRENFLVKIIASFSSCSPHVRKFVTTWGYYKKGKLTHRVSVAYINKNNHFFFISLLLPIDKQKQSAQFSFCSWEFVFFFK